MAIAYNAASSTSQAAGDSLLSVSHTAAGSDRVVLIGVYVEGSTFTTCSYGAQTPTAVLTSADSSLRVYRLIAPNTGAQTVTINYAGAASRSALGVLSYTGVDQTTPINDSDLAFNEASPISVTLSSAAGELVVDFAAITGAAAAADGSQTERISLDSFSSEFRCFGASEKAGGASVTMQWTDADALYNNLIAVALNPAGAATSILRQMMMNH